MRMPTVIVLFLGLVTVIVIGARLTVEVTRKEKLQPSSFTPETTSSTTPLHPLSVAGMKQNTIKAEDFKIVREVRKTDRFVSKVVEFKVDGIRQYALMNIPTGLRPEAGWPVVIVNHGYIPPAEFSTERSYINTSAYFATAGFLVLKPDYRGHAESAGTAESIQDRIGYGVDVLGLIRAITEIQEADPNSVFVFGHSMGGDVSLRVALVCGNCIRGLSLWAPAVTTYPQQLTYFRRQSEAEVNRILNEYEQLTMKVSGEEFSTFAKLGKLAVPVVIHHGTNDESVPYQWGVDLHNKLISLGKQSKLYTYNGDDHDISNNWSAALKRDADWFRELANE